MNTPGDKTSNLNLAGFPSFLLQHLCRYMYKRFLTSNLSFQKIPVSGNIQSSVVVWRTSRQHIEKKVVHPSIPSIKTAQIILFAWKYTMSEWNITSLLDFVYYYLCLWKYTYSYKTKTFISVLFEIMLHPAKYTWMCDCMHIVNDKNVNNF